MKLFRMKKKKNYDKKAFKFWNLCKKNYLKT